MLAACSFGSPAGKPGGDAPSELDAPVIDAPVDAAPDAAMIDPASCSFPGVRCPGDQPLEILPCGSAGECWVGCVNGTPLTVAAATQFCASLGTRIGVFDDGADETCVRMNGINGAIMLGMTQLPDQASDGEGWVRIADDMPVQYFNWAGGQPNDGDGAENNEEQCAYSSSSATWQDTACASFTSARWICRYP